MTRPVPLMIPTVTVWSRPNGLPIAITGSATRSAVELPSAIAGRPVASTLMTAMSVSGSLPTSLAASFRPSLRVTSMALAPSTTWWLVTM